MDWQALALTLKLATVTTAILLAVAVPLAALLVLGRSRWLAALEALAALPLVLPPTVLGFFLLVLLGPRTAFGRGITSLLGHPLAFSFSGLVVGSVIYSLPFAVQPLVAGFAAVEPALVDAARLLGASPARLVLTLLVPLARRSLIAGAVLSFAQANNLRRATGSGEPLYRYEQDVEQFFRHSPAVIRDADS